MTKEELTTLIQAATSYYNGRSTGMTDQQYDELLEKAKIDFPGFNIFDKIVIGEDRSTVKHSYPFLAQEFKVQFSNQEEYDKLTKNLEGWYRTPKYDGCSIRSYYVNGKLTDIITRSDEESGKRKYDQLKNKVPNEVDPRVICIDFEALCSKEDYNDDTRSNANGLVNSCYKQDEIDKYLVLIPFKVTTNENLDYLESMKLVFKDNEFIILKDNSTIDRFIEFNGKHYPIDGHVFYSNTRTNHKIFKFYYNQVPTSIVTKIDWRYTDKLCWTPTVLFNTVKIDGRSVSSASSNGFERLRSLKAGVGAKIEIILANSTIPQIHKVLEPSEDYQMPTTCPYCGGRLALCCSKLRCENKYCSNLVNEFNRCLLKAADSNNIVNKVNTIEELKNEFNNCNKSYSKDEILTRFIKKLPIERFNKYDQLIDKIKNNLDKVINGSTLDLDLWMLTWNQMEVYKHYQAIVDDIIRLIME